MNERKEQLITKLNIEGMADYTMANVTLATRKKGMGTTKRPFLS